MRKSQCEKVTDYIKRTANIPLDVKLWSRSKADLARNETIKRKAKYIALNTGEWLLRISTGTLAAITVFFAVLNSTSYYYPLAAFVVGIFSLVLLLRNREKVGRTYPHFEVYDFLNEELTDEQRHNAAATIRKIRDDRTQLIEFGINDDGFAVPFEGVKVLNWFFLLSDTDTDRQAIWLDGEYPKGPLYIRRVLETETAAECLLPPSPSSMSSTTQLANNKTDGSKAKWHRIKRLHTRRLFSDINLLENFINFADGQVLTVYRNAWLQGMKILLDNYSDYILYLNGQEGTGWERKFERLFTPTFMKTAKRYKSLIASLSDQEIAKLDSYSIAGENTRKFLTGRVPGLENWVKEVDINTL